MTGPTPTRRGFLRLVAASAGAPVLGVLGGCEGPPIEEVYPQGVASADPSTTSIILWTRVQPPEDALTRPIDVTFEVATDDTFSEVIASGDLVAEIAWDHTVRVRVDSLTAGTHYRYRFAARGTTSVTGETRTAPPADSEAPVRVGLAACQDWIGRYYQAWAALLAEPAVDFVLFMGDWIYETVNDPRHQVPKEGRELVLPDGLPIDNEDPLNVAARSLGDYRALHRAVRSDEHLQEVCRRFPMICLWDDHEFTNDCWGDHANEFDGIAGDEQSTRRREDATRGWFEYVPADVPYDPDAGFPDDITTYRRIRWGRHVDLILTDVRYYRDDHVVPEGPPAPDVGKLTANTPLGARIFAQKPGFDVREADALPTMLGATQKQWLLDALADSDATWRVWGSPLLVAQMIVDLRDYDTVSDAFRHVWYFKPDHWDGFRTERREILDAVEADGRGGLLVLSGDLHGFYASVLRADFDDPDSPAMGVELQTSSISSITLFDQLEEIGADQPLLAQAGLIELVPQFDEELLRSGPHFAHVDSVTNGVTVLEIGPTGIDAAFISVDPEVVRNTPDWDGTTTRVRMFIPRDEARIDVLD
jgi:alkaline phosphatase D